MKLFLENGENKNYEMQCTISLDDWKMCSIDLLAECVRQSKFYIHNRKPTDMAYYRAIFLMIILFKLMICVAS